ncbi:MAG: agmatine deiminase family protein [Luteitalea sp.]|nr:agmatine deiminase family protein [Luteitalea sp.]
MPAEWHRHESTWLAWPKDPETWPARVPLVQAIFLRMIEVLTAHEQVDLLVDDEETEAHVRAACPWPQARNLRMHRIPTVDAWIRDYGPNFLLGLDGRLAVNHWGFNAWGDKYPPLSVDARVPNVLVPLLGAERFTPGIILEGGAIDVNGGRVVMTTEQCLLNENRNPHLDRTAIEARLREFLGVEQVLWLGQGITGDDTDGHIDDVARFVSADTIICAKEDDPSDANYAPLADNLRRLELARDPAGRPYHVVTLPMPGAITKGSGLPEDRLPASYANFYIANGVVLLPVFGHATNDQRATETLQALFPDRQVVPIHCEPLVWGLGAIHCVTQQQPATGSAPVGSAYVARGL